MAGTDHTRPLIEGGPVIILVRPQLGQNIGMAARAMANFGLGRMRLVAPRDGWPQEDAFAAASGAVHVLENAQLFPDLASAVADCNHVYACTARERGQAKDVIGADVAAARTTAAMAAQETVAIVFGPERSGLENDEVGLADTIITFPVNPGFASLNLAQSVLLVGYEWFRTAHMAAPAPALPKSPPARRESVLSFFEFLKQELDHVGFFAPPEKRPVMTRNMLNIFHRLTMTEQDVRTLRGAIAALVNGRRGVRPPKALRGAAADSETNGAPPA
ncbi:RNA methyltransferase [Camelimonas lactis]|uniref:tRNA/rRNA methyltransferase n=1 Tax=Camelimonas lactis TaxID=659006 RepID=A0A4R2GQ26_9HYPH|nr:RNA methyltransferase [Camelimonas lactis]TCO11504.1 tRNA/rRNA methyltransferase [Camelimonas lactis]